MPEIIKLVKQRHHSDCGVAALAMFAGVSYEEALLALGGVVPLVIFRGAWLTQLREAAERLGIPTTIKSRANLKTDDGILRLHPWSGASHLVVLRGGLLYNTDYRVWKPQDLFAAEKCKPRNILVKDEWDGEL